IMPLPSAEGIRNPELVDPASRLLSARDRSTGAVLWRAVPASDLGGDPLGVQLELQQIWEFSSRISKITSTVTVAEAHGRIVLLSPNKLMTLDSATGCTLNSRAVTASTMVTLTDNAILFGDISGNVHIVDPVTLNELQFIHVADAPLMGEVAVTDGAMFVVAGDGTITKLVADGCR